MTQLTRRQKKRSPRDRGQGGKRRGEMRSDRGGKETVDKEKKERNQQGDK